MERLRLEPFESGDIARLMLWLDSPEIFWNWTGDWLQYPLTVEQFAPKVAETRLVSPTRYIFKAIEQTTDEVVGQFEIRRPWPRQKLVSALPFSP